MRIALALSGGVDSAVAAHLLAREGHEIVALTMSLGDLTPGPAATRWFTGSTERARETAAALGIEIVVVDVGREFERSVVGGFVREYARGRTPNPCVVCNRAVKFGVLLEAAESVGAAALATGHHARVIRGETAGRFFLARGRDTTRDQSYFLYRLRERELAKIVMPVGEISKGEVLKVAMEAGLPAAGRVESRDTCFAPPGEIEAFLRVHAPESVQPGPIESLDGETLGEHRGIGLYTVGQRSGLGLARPERSYVVRIDPGRRAVIVGGESDLLATELRAEDLAWVAGSPPGSGFEAAARIRLGTTPVGCVVRLGEGAARVRFSRPVRAVAPGQSIVFYEGEIVLGGGVIAAPGRS